MTDKLEYRWLVAHARDDGGLRGAVILPLKGLAEELAGDLKSSSVDGVKIYLIDLHELTPVAVTGNAE
jgi:hypothetical protein